MMRMVILCFIKSFDFNIHDIHCLWNIVKIHIYKEFKLS